jgi:hypothetical protein
MSKRWALAGAVAVTSILAAAALGARFATAKAHKGRTITVVIKNRDYHVISSGQSYGDIRVGNADLWNKQQTKLVGSFHIFCSLTDPTGHHGENAQVTECIYTFRLKGGEITTQGVSNRSSISSVANPDYEAITGGTQKYEGATGQAHLLKSQADQRTVVLQLLR